MIVIAILGGLLLVGCCGGVVVIGGFFMVGTVARDAQMEALNAQDQAQQQFEAAKQEMERSNENIEGMRVPNDLPNNFPPLPVVPPAPAFPDEAEKK